MADPIRLIVMDMDGTLIYTPCLEIPPVNAAALREAADRGIHLALCSGRLPDDAGLFAVHAGLPMHILALNGTCRLDAPLGRIIASEMLSPALLARLIPALQDTGLVLGLFRENELLISHPPVSDAELTRCWGTHALSPEGRCVVHIGTDMLPDMIRRGVSKIVLFDPAMSGRLPALGEKLQAQFPETEITTSWINNLEINPRGVNKGTAVAALADDLDIPMSQVMAIGDNDNDLPMLTCAGYSVAMGNATPAVRSSAAYTTLPCTEHGVAQAIRVLALGKALEGVCRQ